MPCKAFGLEFQGVFDRADRRAIHTPIAFRTPDTLLTVNRQMIGADFRATVTVNAGLCVSLNPCRTYQGKQSHERSIGAKVSTPTVPDQKGRKSQNDKNDGREGGYPGKEEEHLHIGYLVVGTVQKGVNGRLAH
jgi:hypothetical protein